MNPSAWMEGANMWLSWWSLWISQWDTHPKNNHLIRLDILDVLQIATQGNHTPSHSLLWKGVNVHDFSLVCTGTNQFQQDYQVDLMGFYYESIPCPKQSQSRHPFGRVRRMGEDSGCDHFIIKVYRPTTIGLHGMDQGICAKTHEKST